MLPLTGLGVGSCAAGPGWSELVNLTDPTEVITGMWLCCLARLPERLSRWVWRTLPAASVPGRVRHAGRVALSARGDAAVRQRGWPAVEPVSWAGSRAPTMTPVRATTMPNENASATAGPCPIPGAAAATIDPATPVPRA